MKKITVLSGSNNPPPLKFKVFEKIGLGYINTRVMIDMTCRWCNEIRQINPPCCDLSLIDHVIES
jgi:hypothetical protein